MGNNQTRDRYDCGLTLLEKDVLKFIRARTLGYGKFIEEIPRRHFLEGVFDANGKLVQAPCDVRCHKMLKKAIDGLEARGEITRFRKKSYKNKVGKPTFVYMPLSRTVLCKEIAAVTA